MKKDPPDKKSKTTSSVKISDLETYSRRQRAYSDSLLLHNLSYAQYNAMPGKRDLREKVSKHIYKPGAEVKERISKGGKVEEHVYKDPDFKLKNGERGIADYWHPEISPTKEYIGYNMDPDNAANMLSTMLVGKDNRKSSMNQLYDKPTQPVVYQPEKKPAPTEKVDVYKEPTQPVVYKKRPSYQEAPIKTPNLQSQQVEERPLQTVPVQNAITYPKDVRRYTAGQYLESQGKSSGYVNFGKNKGREEMKKYQFGGGLNYTGFTPTYTPSTSTSLQFSDPSIANPSIYRAKPSQGTGMSANTTQGLVGAGVAALGSAVQGISAGISAQASVDAIKQAKLKRGLSKVEEGRMRADSLPKTGYYGYTYPKQRMQYGGYGNSGGVAYDPTLAGMDPDQVERGGQRAITEGTTEAVVSAIPVVGQIIGAATGAVKGVQSAAGKERMMVDGKTIDAYPDSTAAGVGNAMKMFTPHQSGFDHAENKDYGRAVLSWTGLGVIPDMIEGMSDQEDAERERIKNKVT